MSVYAQRFVQHLITTYCARADKYTKSPGLVCITPGLEHSTERTNLWGGNINRYA